MIACSILFITVTNIDVTIAVIPCLCVCVSVCMYVCMSVFIHIYIYIYIYVKRWYCVETAEPNVKKVFTIL